MSTKENKAFIRRQVEDVWNNHNKDSLATYWDEKLCEEIGQSHSMLLTAFPDLQITIEDLIAEDDKVVGRIRFHGTHLGPFFSIAPTGNHIEWEGVRYWRVSNSKIVETWAIRDRLDVRQQLGVMPQLTQS